MALQFFGGIALGPLAQELLNLIKDTTVKIIHFRKYLQKLQSTLETLIPLIEIAEKMKDRPKTHIQEMRVVLEKGKELVIKCSNVRTTNYFKRWWYSRKILNLEQDLLQFFQMIVPADTLRIVLMILAEAKERESSESGFACVVPVPDMTFGLDSPMEKLKHQLLFKKDVRILGLCAAGGSGKTTLAAKLCRDEDVKGKFENIFFLRVSNSPNLEKIVKILSRQMENQVPTFEDDEDVVTKLGNLLERYSNTLLVLDDVWDNSFVQKFVFMVRGYKILVTSRTKHPTFDYTYCLGMLREPDDMLLFRHWAFPLNENESYKEPDRNILNKIVSGCKGHPLALKMIGRSLRQQPAKEWQKKERMLSSCSILESDSDLLKCLGSSLNYLNKDVQECFMDLGAFPKDQRIPASSLIDIWVELYGRDEVVAYLNLHTLSTRTLVNMFELTRGEAGEIDGNLNKLFVTQHDLLRDLAIYQSRQQGKRLIMERREDNLPDVWRKQKHQHIRLVSIQTGELFSSNWYHMHFPKAEVLILDCFATKYTLPPFMKTMKKLKVLIITNHGQYCTELSYSTKVGSLSRLKRVRLEKVLVPSLSQIKKPLKNLQKISLFMCEVVQAFSSCNFHFPFMFPNLVEINIDYCNDLVELPQGICDLAHLKNLSITNCHELSALPERIGCITDLEVLRLHACTNLSKLPDSLRELQKQLRFLDVSDCINMKLPEWIGELSNLRTLIMKGCSEPEELPRSAMKLVHLEKVICDEETKSIWESLELPELNNNITVPKDINLNWLGVEL